jgi:cystathionine beta-lyase
VRVAPGTGSIGWVETAASNNPLAEVSLDQLRRRRSVKWRQFDEDVLPLWVAEMDTPLAAPIRDALKAAVDAGDTGYSHPGDLPEVFAAFAAKRFGWRPDPGRCWLTSDVLHGIVEVLRLLTAPGDGVVINTPSYPPFFGHIRGTERRVVESPLATDGDGRYVLDLDRLAVQFTDAKTTAFLLCNPHNPTGTVFGSGELSAVAELAARHRVRVLADEVHAPLLYGDAVHVPFLDLDPTAVGFVSASKAWNLAGLKAALVVGGTGAAELERMPAETPFAASLLGVVASVAAFTSGVPWLDSLMTGLDANRHLLGELLADALPKVGYRLPEATYLAWLDCRGYGLGDDPAAVFLEHGRVAVNAGPTFGTPGEGFVRLNFATAPEHLTEGVRRMATAISRYQESR